MGCTQSKIEHEEAVTRCKDRKRYMKDAVSARNAFASAHSAYTVSLKNIGAALSDYGQAELHDLQSAQSATGPGPGAPPPVDPLPPPPPPLPNNPLPLQRAASMPEFVMIPKHEPKPAETIQEEDDEDLHESVSSSPNNNPSSNWKEGVAAPPTPPTPPAPPSPPRPLSPPSPRRKAPVNTGPPPPPPDAKETPYDYIFNVDMPGPSLSGTDEISQYKEEPDERRERRYGDEIKLKENNGGDVASTGVTSTGASSSSKVEPKVVPEKVIEPEEVKPVKKVKQPAVQINNVPVEGKRGVKVVGNVSLTQILNELDDKFLKASESAHVVSRLLEANRMHYHSNFADNRGHIDHSAKLMRVITWNRSFRGLQNTEDVHDDVDANETLATVLDKLLAWEKKLYDEVKAGELMKIEYQKKVALLNKQSQRGTKPETLEKAKAAVGHMHTRYIVDIQTMDSTVAEITRLRDDHLYPNLVSLVDGMARMWETMSVQHRSQMKIVEYLKSLGVSQGPKETSEDHHQRTLQLWAVAEDWQSHFQKLVTLQKKYILALNNWLKLNLIPIESNLKEQVSSPPRIRRPPIQSLLIAWHDHLEKLPDELARSAISSFAAIMKHIVVHQEDEEKLKRKCEDTRKELTRRTREFEDFYHKHMQRKTPQDETDDTNLKDPIGEKQFVIESLKSRLEEEVEAYQKHCRQVREKSLGSLKTHLPELFRAMSDFSSACSDMYKRLLSITKSQKQTETMS